MHMDIGLSLLSELELLRRAFWQHHDCQNHFHNQEKTLDSHEQNQCSQPHGQSPKPQQYSGNAINYIEPNNVTQIHGQKSTPESHLDRQQHTHGHHDTGTENNLSKECIDHAHDKSQMCSRSAKTELGKNDSEPYEHNSPSGQPKTQQRDSQQFNMPGRIRRVPWKKTTEDSSFL